MNKILQDLDLDAKDEVSNVEDEILNPSNHLHAPIVAATVGAAHVVEDIASAGEAAKNDIEDFAGKIAGNIGIPDHGV